MNEARRTTFVVLAAVVVGFIGCSSSEPSDGSGGSTSTGGVGGNTVGGTTAGGGDAGAWVLGGSAGSGAAGGGATGGDAPDGSDSGGAPECPGPVLQGSFVIHNALDIQAVATYAQITGDLTIDGAGITSVSLPSLCSVGGVILADLNAAELATVDLPELKYAGGIEIVNGPLHTVNLGKLVKVADGLGLDSDGVISLPALESAVDIFLGGHPTQVDAPKLTSCEAFGVSCYPTCPAVTINAITALKSLTTFGGKLTAYKLTTVGDLLGAGTYDLPVLKSVTGMLHYGSNSGSQSFPALTSVSGNFSLVKASGTLSFPLLSSIGGDIKIQCTGAGQSVSLPVLTSLDGKTVATTIDVAGSFYAPAVKSANLGIVIRNVSNLDLSALQSVGPVGTAAPCGTDLAGKSAWISTLDLDGSTITTLQLPALTSACALFGKPTSSCSSGNLSLTNVVAPNLTKGGVQFFNNPLLPKCRADALAGQIANPVLFGGSAVFEHCPLAAGPCP